MNKNFGYESSGTELGCAVCFALLQMLTESKVPSPSEINLRGRIVQQIEVMYHGIGHYGFFSWAEFPLYFQLIQIKPFGLKYTIEVISCISVTQYPTLTPAGKLLFLLQSKFPSCEF